jgi:FAS-associated factor 2
MYNTIYNANSTFQGLLRNIFSFLVSLISSDDLDPSAASSNFLSQFESTYGHIHPAFICGPFQSACNQAKAENKLLIIYLHSPNHQDTSVFCRNILCNEQIVQYFNVNFLCWAGNVFNSEPFKVSNTLKASSYPFLAVICYNVTSNSRNGITVLEKIEGIIDVENLLERLTQTLENYGPILDAAHFEIQERETNRQIREEQDRAFEESLAEDQERERKAREENRKIMEQLEKEKREKQLEDKKLQEIERKRQRCRERLPIEPEAGDEGITQLLIRLTDGSRLQRRFKTTDTLQVVFDFIDSSPHNLNEYELVTNFPRKVFNDPQVTLKEAGLFPQASLFVQEK